MIYCNCVLMIVKRRCLSAGVTFCCNKSLASAVGIVHRMPGCECCLLAVRNERRPEPYFSAVPKDMVVYHGSVTFSILRLPVRVEARNSARLFGNPRLFRVSRKDNIVLCNGGPSMWSFDRNTFRASCDSNPSFFNIF